MVSLFFVLLDRKSLASEPFCDICRKKWREGSVNPIVVVVKPLDAIRTEEFRNDCRSVDVTAGQSLELEPVAELVDACLLAEDYILMSYAMHTFSIECWFI